MTKYKNMDLSQLPPKLKIHHDKADYEKVYEYPLEWCPLFGSLPEIEETHLNNNGPAKCAAEECIGIIENARFNLGVFDNYMVRDARLPDVRELIFIYHEYGDVCKSIRLLFQNLDYLALKTSGLYIHNQYSILFNSEIKDLKPGLIRKTRYGTVLSDLAEDADVLRTIGDRLLFEAKNITSYSFELELHHIYSLYAILKAWLALTSLCFYKKWTQEDINELSPSIDKAEKYLQRADYSALVLEKTKLEEKLYIRNERNRQNVAQRWQTELPKLQMKHKTWESEAQSVCKEYYSRGRFIKINDKEIAKRIKKNLDIKESINTLRQDPGVKAAVEYFQNLIKNEKELKYNQETNPQSSIQSVKPSID